MHGIVMTELEKFVTQRHGASAWRDLLSRAQLPNKIYVAAATYPDSEAVALVNAASALTGTPASDLLEAFGEALVPGLLQMYGRMLKPAWKTLDVLEYTETAIHAVVRRQSPGAQPPQLQCARQSANEVLVTYASSRRMCAVAKGIIRGIAAHFGERIFLKETACMLKGAPRCDLSVRLVSAGSVSDGGQATRHVQARPGRSPT
jgi:Haem-NO-binding